MAEEDETKQPDFNQIEDALIDSDHNDAILITWESTGEEHHDFHVQPITTSEYKKEQGFRYGSLIEKMERAIHNLKVEQIAKEVKHKFKHNIAEEL